MLSEKLTEIISLKILHYYICSVILLKEIVYMNYPRLVIKLHEASTLIKKALYSLLIILFLVLLTGSYRKCVICSLGSSHRVIFLYSNRNILICIPCVVCYAKAACADNCPHLVSLMEQLSRCDMVCCLRRRTVSVTAVRTRL